jgi:acetyl esterase/lipase
MGDLIRQNPDGTYTRLVSMPTTPASADPSSLSEVLTKDVTFNPTNNTWVRIYLPKKALVNNSSSTTNKLPLIVYYHGGGFYFTTVATTLNHNFCDTMSTQLDAVVVSVEYRMAPENRLPAAYDDAMEALDWIKSTDEIWLREYADISNCFLIGTSAGGNILHHVGVRASAAVEELAPLKIRGLIFHHPFFGGVTRTESEIRGVNDPVIPQVSTDLCWELGLPIGADRDHKYSNPMADDQWSVNCARIKNLGWRLLVAGGDRDPVFDRQMMFVEMLKKDGVNVISHFIQGNPHGVEITEPSTAPVLFVSIKKFINNDM